MIHHAGVKFVAAAMTGAAGTALGAAEATDHLNVDASALIMFGFAAAFALITALIGSAWKDLRARLAEIKREYEHLRERVGALEGFKARATWACPLMDPSMSPAQQRAHLRAHLEKLGPNGEVPK